MNKKPLYFFLMTIVCFPAVFAQSNPGPVSGAQAGNTNQVTVISEIRYKNDGGPLFYKDIPYQFHYQGTDSAVKVVLSPKETYYTSGKKGTEAIFHFYNAGFRKSDAVIVVGEFYVMLPNKTKLIKATTDPIRIDLSDKKATQLNDITYKLNYAIEITAPEIFSLTMMINYVTEELNKSSTKEGGFAGVVDQLENFKENYYDTKALRYSTLMDFYRLLVFIEDYTKEHSFFNEEAIKLHERIAGLSAQLSGAAKRGGSLAAAVTSPPPGIAAGVSVKDSAVLEEYVSSTEVYEEYQRLSGVLKDYDSRLQLILFLKSR